MELISMALGHSWPNQLNWTNIFKSKAVIWMFNYEKHSRGHMRATRVYCGRSTASEVFLILTTQLYSCLCNYHAIVFIF